MPWGNPMACGMPADVWGLDGSGRGVRIGLWPHLPHGCRRLLSIMPMFGGSTVRFVSSSSSRDPASADPTGGLGSYGLCVHPGQGSLSLCCACVCVGVGGGGWGGLAQVVCRGVGGDAWLYCGLQVAAPIGPSPLTAALPLTPFPPQ